MPRSVLIVLVGTVLFLCSGEFPPVGAWRAQATEKLRGGSAVVPQSSASGTSTQIYPKKFMYFNTLIGTAGWTRTTDLLVHSQAL
jgi:hypothetical protein